MADIIPWAAWAMDLPGERCPGRGRERDGPLVVRSHAALIAVSYRPVEGDS
jgi:hypothetical protein